MPIFRYFLVTGPVLLGLLFLADAKLPPPGPLANSTNFYGLELARAQPTIAHLTVASAPEPDMTSAAVLAAEPQPALATPPSVETAPNKVVKSVAPKKHKRVARKRNWRDAYAEANPWAWRDSNRTRFW